jgi:multiple sugar transport system substrate-binding protein
MINLRILVPQFAFLSFKEPLEDIANDYMRLVGTSVNIQITVAKDFPELESEIRFDVEGKTGQFDVYIFNPVLTGELVMQDGLWDLTDFIKNYQRNPDFWTDILLFYRDILSSYDNRIYLFPFDGDLISLYYRADLLERHGMRPPKTWDEYNDIAMYFHGHQEEQMDPVTGDFRNVTLSGSCIGRVRNCAGMYWTQLVSSSFTQYEGTSTGSLLDTRDLSPLLGPAMEETLRILEVQALYGSEDEFEGCLDNQINHMNNGKCVLSLNWGDSFTQHILPGSVLPGKLGVAPSPGSHRVLDRATKQLVECTPDRCPFSDRHVTADGKEIFVNKAPYAAFGGWSGAVANHVSPEHKRAVADFLAFASDTPKAIKYVIPDQTSGAVHTGQDPYRKSMLAVDPWVAKGYPEEATKTYLDTIQSGLSSKNVVADMRFPLAASILDALDERVYDYLQVALEGNVSDVTQLRKNVAEQIRKDWLKTLDRAENQLEAPVLELYHRERGIYVPPQDEEASSFASNNSVVIISSVVIAGLFVILIAFLSFWISKVCIPKDRTGFLSGYMGRLTSFHRSASIRQIHGTSLHETSLTPTKYLVVATSDWLQRAII